MTHKLLTSDDGRFRSLVSENGTVLARESRGLESSTGPSLWLAVVWDNEGDECEEYDLVGNSEALVEELLDALVDEDLDPEYGPYDWSLRRTY